MLITKLYNDLTYWKKSTYENLRTYDCSDNEAFYENDSSSSLSLPESFYSDDDDIYDDLPVSPVSAKAPKSDHSDNDDDDKSDNSSFIMYKRKAKRKKRSKRRNQFILDEADDDEYGEDSDDDELQNTQSEDHSLRSFIDDGEPEEDDEDVHINYMRSVTDVVNGQGKYKLKYDYDPNIEVYSQFPSTQEIEEDEYDQDDSFICEEIVYSNTQAPPVNISSPRRLRSRKVLKGYKRKESTPVLEKPKKRYRRVFIESP